MRSNTSHRRIKELYLCICFVKGLLNLLVLLFTLPTWAQQTYHARVVDAKTVEPLPYASIYVSKDNGAISDYEGYFTVAANEDDVLSVSYIRYNPRKVKVGDTEGTIRLPPLATIMQEVTVLPTETILKKMLDKLCKEFIRKITAKSNYFMRITQSYGESQEMVETYLTAHSAVNLRDFSFLNGVR